MEDLRKMENPQVQNKPIHNVERELSLSADRLMVVVEEMENGFSSVLAPAPPRVEKIDSGPHPVRAPLTDNLADIDRRINEATTRLREILDRSEV